MTSLVNNSNLNSALINTINASESKYNPNVYNTKRIMPAAAVTYVRTDKSSGTVAPNQTITFDLMKYGICQQINLVYDKTTSAGNIAFSTAGYDFFNVVDRIELLSSSKVIDTLTRYDLLAMWSNLDQSQFNIVNKSAIAARDGTVSTNQLFRHKFVIPLRFGLFSDINTNLNLQFNEPMSIRIRWGPTFAAGTSAAIIDEESVQLSVRYKAYNEADFSEILAQNYNEPELNQLSTGFYDENIVSQTLTQVAGAAVDSTVRMNLNDKGARVELKNTDCVNDFYVMVIRNGVPSSLTGELHQPVKINRVRMTASGQELFDLEDTELFFSKLCMNGFSTLPDNTSDIYNIVKIQSGLWEYAGGGTQSNTVSLRELNNPIIEVWFEDRIQNSDAAATKTVEYDVIVCEDAVKIYSTTSATGRLQTALTN